MRKTNALFLSAFLFLTGCAQNQSTTSKFTNVYEATSEYDGLWNYATIEDQVYAIDQSDTYSIQFWIKPTNNWPDTVLVEGYLNDSHFYQLKGSADNGEFITGLTLEIADENDVIFLDASEKIQTNRWNRVAINMNNSSIEVYLNGALLIQNDNGGMPINELRMGTSILGAYAKGDLSELVVTEELTDETTELSIYQSKYAAVLLDTVSYPDQDRLERSLWFDSNTIEGYDLNWQVLTSDRMDYRGVISDLSIEGDIEAIASISTEYSQASKSFTFHVAGQSNQVLLENDLKALHADIKGVIHSGTQLPMTETNGSTVTYEVLSGHAMVEDGILTKVDGDEYESIKLKATLQREGESISYTYDIVLLDEVYGYAMAYFKGELEEEKGYLALSTDGYNWQKQDSIIIESTMFGTHRIRDPYLARSKDGSFLLLATQGFDNPEIYLFNSQDLVTYTNERLLRVNVEDQGLGMTGTRAWAPALLYDNENDAYVIYYSDPQSEYGPIFAVRTADFYDLNYPTILFNPGYPVIDGVIVPMDGQYVMMYKDERKAALTIFYAVTSDLESGFQKAYDQTFLFEKKSVEGPTIFRNGDHYTIYIDGYSYQTFYAGDFTVLSEENDLTWRTEDTYTLPEDGLRHGSVLPLTEKEYHRIEERAS